MAPACCAGDCSGAGFGGGMSAGERFVMSDGYKAVKDAAARGRTWGRARSTSGCPESATSQGHAARGLRQPRFGTGGGWVPATQVVQGAVQKLFQPLRFQSLLMGGLAETSTIRCATESTATSAAAGVAEGG